ncbi:MAG: M23 family metallopeptidase [Myxococcales bacterium]|nr:M23 family metallopeptidase [Myxococcales bacterium]
MDRGSARVVAAAGGEVVEVEDGHYDRCSGSIQQFEPDCDGHPIIANKVVIAHANGWRTRYLHLMRDSTAVRVGDRVECGELLGRVGSSGRSFTPHLHFEVHDPLGASIDPFAGEVSGPQSLWVEQRAPDGLPGPACDPRWRRPAP